MELNKYYLAEAEGKGQNVQKTETSENEIDEIQTTEQNTGPSFENKAFFTSSNTVPPMYEPLSETLINIANTTYDNLQTTQQRYDFLDCITAIFLGEAEQSKRSEIFTDKGTLTFGGVSKDNNRIYGLENDEEEAKKFGNRVKNAFKDLSNKDISRKDRAASAEYSLKGNSKGRENIEGNAKKFIEAVYPDYVKIQNWNSIRTSFREIYTTYGFEILNGRYRAPLLIKAIVVAEMKKIESVDSKECHLTASMVDVLCSNSTDFFENAFNSARLFRGKYGSPFYSPETYKSGINNASQVFSVLNNCFADNSKWGNLINVANGLLPKSAGNGSEVAKDIKKVYRSGKGSSTGIARYILMAGNGTLRSGYSMSNIIKDMEKYSTYRGGKDDGSTYTKGEFSNKLSNSSNSGVGIEDSDAILKALADGGFDIKKDKEKLKKVRTVLANM